MLLFLFFVCSRSSRSWSASVTAWVLVSPVICATVEASSSARRFLMFNANVDFLTYNYINTFQV